MVCDIYSFFLFFKKKPPRNHPVRPNKRAHQCGVKESLENGALRIATSAAGGVGEEGQIVMYVGRRKERRKKMIYVAYKKSIIKNAIKV